MHKKESQVYDLIRKSFSLKNKKDKKICGRNWSLLKIGLLDSGKEIWLSKISIFSSKC